jgi:hypothetical protein
MLFTNVALNNIIHACIHATTSSSSVPSLLLPQKESTTTVPAMKEPEGNGTSPAFVWNGRSKTGTISVNLFSPKL